MAGFLYFAEKDITPEVLSELGLNYAFPGGEYMRREVRGNSPSKKPGCLIGNLKAMGQKEIGYWPEQQVWMSRPKYGYWLGYYKDDKPGPKDLARDRRLEGPSVYLADGFEWQVPLVRRRGAVPALPQYHVLNEEDEWVLGGFKPEHERLWDETGRFMDAAMRAIADESGAETDANDVDFGYDDADDLAAELLGHNYRIGRGEASLLHLFDNNAASQVILASCDFSGFLNWLNDYSKKNAPQESSTQSTQLGNSDGIPATNQLGET